MFLPERKSILRIREFKIVRRLSDLKESGGGDAFLFDYSIGVGIFLFYFKILKLN